jgi:hypothetical protein
MSGPSRRKPLIDADAAYENAHLVTQDLLERIRELLFDLPAPGNDERPVRWSQVSAVCEVAQRLAATVGLLERAGASPHAPAAAIDRIAKEVLDLETLQTRRSDQLDFHELAVWQVRQALEVAFQAGVEAGSGAEPARRPRRPETS